MPVNNIVLQPSSGSLQAAYRPVVFKVEATSTSGGAKPPFVACDIYLGDKYYKSMIRTAPDAIDNLKSTFVFDVSDALQESLSVDVAPIENSQLLQAKHMSAKVFCRFRASDIDPDGFTVEEGTKPVQGTKFTEPTSGDGLQSNVFYAINSALQHEDNQDLASHLNSYKTGTWNAKAFPLSHRSKYFFCPNCSDHFPFIFTNPCVQAELLLYYRLNGSNAFQLKTASDNNPCAAITYSTNVTGNRIDVDLDNPIAAGQKVFVRYRAQGSGDPWTDVGYFTTQSFFFNVLVAGDYEMEVILFCSSCLNSNPEPGSFTIATSTNLAWRGINPYCVVQNLGQDVYIEFEIRNLADEEFAYPDNITPSYHQLQTKGDLYVKFFSDSQHLNPLNVVGNLKIYVKQTAATTDYSGGNYYYRDFESVYTYEITANGTEALVTGNALTHSLSENYEPYPTLTSSTEAYYAYAPFPDDKLVGGNTGYRGYADLEQYNVVTNAPTGVTKPNDAGDPDYIAPVLNTAACPSGVAYTSVSYGFALQIAKVELRIGSVFPYNYVYAPTVVNTGAGGYNYMLSVPKDQPFAITIKAKSLASGVNNDGWISVTVQFDDWTIPVQNFQIRDNIETTLPGTFQGVSNINISNN